MTRLVHGASHGVMSGGKAGLGAFTRMLRTNKNARKLIQNKVRGARQQMQRVHSRYLHMVHSSRKKRVRG